MIDTRHPMVRMSSITKYFLDVTANDKVNFDLYPGEICSLLGENGAGKTTLMNILFGYYVCDEGEIFIKGEKADLSSPKDAISRGVGMIHQHFALVPTQTVLENIIIGTDSSKTIFLDLKTARQKLLKLEQRFGLEIDPDAHVWTLSVGEQQKVEILKALYRDVDILIMDEPTAVLAPAETDDLFSTLKSLVSEGRSVVFISHKLNEVMDISDRIVVLRDGRVVAERQTAETSARELANLMVGRDLAESTDKRQLEPGRPVLEIQHLDVLNDMKLPAIKNLSLVVRQNEILGIAGISGNGQRELSEVLFGMRNPVRGIIKINNTPLKSGNPSSAITLNMARIPEDRMDTGLLMDLSVEENMILEDHVSADFQTYGFIKSKKIHQYTDELIRAYNISTAGRDAVTKSLSGGNLQKVMLARELAGNPTVVIAAQPTRGLDVGAMEYIHQRLLQERERGAGILLISEDLDEIFSLSDRIAVIYEGKIMGEAVAENISREQIGLWMSGITREN
ncbi:MAG: ABC transporter ATP-binding protein [Deltaproteobacteria bacterium]|nr:ABC transporter ATP-binding protein [Deltaproteobacteria bacterium]